MSSVKGPFTKVQRSKVMEAARAMATACEQFAITLEDNDAQAIVHSSLDVLIAQQRFENTLGHVVQEVEQ